MAGATQVHQNHAMVPENPLQNPSLFVSSRMSPWVEHHSKKMQNDKEHLQHNGGGRKTKPSIVTEWLYQTPQTSRNPMAAHKRRQNKYFQLSSCLFGGDQEERDRIEKSREKDAAFLRQVGLENSKLRNYRQELEDAEIYSTMSVPHLGPRAPPLEYRGSYQPSFHEGSRSRSRSQTRRKNHRRRNSFDFAPTDGPPKTKNYNRRSS